jgi:hypothetical protein
VFGAEANDIAGHTAMTAASNNECRNQARPECPPVPFPDALAPTDINVRMLMRLSRPSTLDTVNLDGSRRTDNTAPREGHPRAGAV